MQALKKIECPLCAADAADRPTNKDALMVECSACGSYEISRSAAVIWQAQHQMTSPRTIANVRGWIRDNQGMVINSTDIDRLMTIRSITVGERAERLLKAIAKTNPDIGGKILIPFGTVDALAWHAVSWSAHHDELVFLVNQYLVEEKRWLVRANPSEPIFKITPAGHDYLEQIRKGGLDSTIGFCAMWFGETVAPVWTHAIEPAILGAGYSPVRIDNVQHNNKIDDEILAHIRRSKFVVADFTGSRGGVYFEAGFALGLGRQVIWTVSDDELDKVHFDNRQYNFTTWKLDALPDFAKRLQLRIEATLGRGALVSA